MQAMIKRFLIVLVTAVLCVVTVFCGQGNLSAYADSADSVQKTYESTNVLNNLKGATIGGKEFDLADYPHNSNGKPQIISFIEFCYSYYAEKQADYGLYVYVYNPQDTAFDMSTGRNKIQFTYGEKQSYAKYSLEFINYSTEAGYEGRFWKFKVKLSDSQKSDILRGVDEANRIYKVSGIELSVKNNVTEYPCGQTYTYSGYAEGYGSELAQGDTLTCTVDGLELYLSLDVQSTYYRPKDTNGAAYERDTLHSVYFSVPDDIISEYGEMTAVHATWLNALTNPILVTGNSTVYNVVLPYIGQTVDGGNFTYASDDNSPVPYAIIASKYIESASWNNASYGSSFMSYNANRHYTISEKNLSTLYYCFLADNGDADNYALPAEALIDYFGTYTNEHGGNSVADKYSTDLFESYDGAFTDITISSDETFTLTDEVISQDLWQKFVGGGYHVTGTNAYTVSAIKRVQSTDFKATQAETCEGLFIDESDYAEFKKYYDTATANKETVYLFRYYQSDYSCYEAVEYKRGKGDWTLLGTQFGYEYVDTNAYLMQMWVQLDFDIIDLTFTKDGVATVIPVIMLPMDIAADGKPPVITTSDGGLEWWQIVLGIIGLIFIVWLLIKFLPWIIYGLIKLVCLPFKVIGKLFKRRKDKVETNDFNWYDEYIADYDEGIDFNDFDDFEW